MSSRDLTDMLADELVAYTLDFLDRPDLIRCASLSKRLRTIARDVEGYVFPAKLNASIKDFHGFRSDCRKFAKHLEYLNGAGLPVDIWIYISSHDVYEEPGDSEPDSDQQNPVPSPSDGASVINAHLAGHSWTRAAFALRQSMTSGRVVDLKLKLPVTEFEDIAPALAWPGPRLRSFMLLSGEPIGQINLSHDLFAGYAPRLRSVEVGPLVLLPQPRLSQPIFSGVKFVRITLGPLLEGLEDIRVQFPAARHLVLTPDIVHGNVTSTPRGKVSSKPRYNATSSTGTRNVGVDILPHSLRQLCLNLPTRETCTDQYASLSRRLGADIRTHQGSINTDVLPSIRLLLANSRMLTGYCIPTFVASLFRPREPLAITLEMMQYSFMEYNVVVSLHNDCNPQARLEVVLNEFRWPGMRPMGDDTTERLKAMFEPVVCLTITVEWSKKGFLRNWLQLPNLETVRVILTSDHDVKFPANVEGLQRTGENLQIVLVAPDGPRRSVSSAYVQSVANCLGSLAERPTQLELENICIEI